MDSLDWLKCPTRLALNQACSISLFDQFNVVWLHRCLHRVSSGFHIFVDEHGIYIWVECGGNIWMTHGGNTYGWKYIYGWNVEIYIDDTMTHGGSTVMGGMWRMWREQK